MIQSEYPPSDADRESFLNHLISCIPDDKSYLLKNEDLINLGVNGKDGIFYIIYKYLSRGRTIDDAFESFILRVLNQSKSGKDINISKLSKYTEVGFSGIEEYTRDSRVNIAFYPFIDLEVSEENRIIIDRLSKEGKLPPSSFNFVLSEGDLEEGMYKVFLIQDPNTEDEEIVYPDEGDYLGPYLEVQNVQ